MLTYNGQNVDNVNYNGQPCNYVIKDGKLVWANPELWISSAGAPYLNTNYIANINTRQECVFSPVTLEAGVSNTARLFGNNGVYQGTDNFGFTYWATSSWWPLVGTTEAAAGITGFAWSISEKYKIILNAKEGGPQVLSYYNGSIIAQQNSNYGYLSSSKQTVLFTNITGTSGQPKKIYDFKIFENDILIKHFIPVPEGLQIGDFTVPSNGMFDIVEQKFYGNSGTGTFEYGKDS